MRVVQMPLMSIAAISLFLLPSITIAGQVIYVDQDATEAPHDGSSWCNAIVNLQDALSIATAGDEIRVGDGIQKPDQGGRQVAGDRLASFQLVNGLTLEGGYAGCGAKNPDARDTEAFETVLSGDLNGDDGPKFLNNEENSFHVVAATDADNTTSLDGFTISGGNANAFPNEAGGGMLNNNSSPTVTDCTFAGNSAVNGGGMMIDQESTPVLTNCTFSANTATEGGGLFVNRSAPTLNNCMFLGNSAVGDGGITGNGGGMRSSLSNSTVTDCTFSENTAVNGGGMRNDTNSNPTVTNCIFTQNHATNSGGGMSNTGSNPTVDECTFVGNTALNNDGGAIMNSEQSSPIIRDCEFLGNQARAGGAIYTSGLGCSPIIGRCRFISNVSPEVGGALHIGDLSDPQMSNCIFRNNTASLGGAVHGSGGSSPAFLNCTFSANSADEGGAWYNELATFPIFVNSIFWSNGPAPIVGSLVSATYCDVEGGFTGEGNIDADPLFVDPDGADDVAGNEDDNLRLSPGSPAIDAGDNTLLSAATDLDGNPRVINGNVDMGAYEFQGPSCSVEPATCWTETFTDGVGRFTTTIGDGDTLFIHDGATASLDATFVRGTTRHARLAPLDTTFGRTDVVSFAVVLTPVSFVGGGRPRIGFFDLAAGNPVVVVELDIFPLSSKDYAVLMNTDSGRLEFGLSTPETSWNFGNTYLLEVTIDGPANTLGFSVAILQDDIYVAQGGDTWPIPADVEYQFDAIGISNLLDDQGIGNTFFAFVDDFSFGTAACGATDCNENGIADACDIEDKTSKDFNDNGIPDECEPDCQPNDIPDFVDISLGLSEDCNENEVPDECDVRDEISLDCNGNKVPDECDLDDGTSSDCNENGIPDECDIDGKTSTDCDTNEIPDECEADGDDDGIIDACDNCVGVVNSDQADFDQDGIGDVCDPDTDNDGVLNESDVCPFTKVGAAVDGEGRSLGDIDEDCDTDLVDFDLFQQGFTGPK